VGAPQIIAGSSTTYSATTFTGAFTISSNNATVSNCPAAGCTGGVVAANPTTATLTATANGTTGTFNNPFAGGVVNFWYRLSGAGQPWYFLQVAGPGGSVDNGVTRQWLYTATVSFPKTFPTGASLTVNGTQVDILAVGVNAAGDGVFSNGVTTITLSNP